MILDLDIFVDLVEELIKEEKTEPVIMPVPVTELCQRIDVCLQDEPIVDEEFISILRKLILNTPRTATNMFYNQLFGGRNSKAVLGDLLSVVLNNSMYTLKVAGPQVVVEKEILNKISGMIGYDIEVSDGVLAPGGSMTNLMGLLMARDKKDPNARLDGLSKKLVVYSSQESHYSMAKNAAFSGIGRNNVRYVVADEYGKMDVEKLEKAIQKDIVDGYTPCMVNATAGTTVLCAFDPIYEIGLLCKKYDIWLHVDGAYGGAVMFSDKLRHHIEGSEMADSFTLNAHKMLATPLSCSIIVVKDKKHLYDTFSNDATYLYQTSKDEYNPGKISMQCGRKNDALKFWTLWKSIGTNGLRDLVEYQFDLAEYARDYVADNPDYTLYNTGDSIAVCFNYKEHDPKTLCTDLYNNGEIMVGYGRFRDNVFIRLVTINSGNNKEDIMLFFKKLEEFVE